MIGRICRNEGLVFVRVRIANKYFCFSLYESFFSISPCVTLNIRPASQLHTHTPRMPTAFKTLLNISDDTYPPTLRTADTWGLSGTITHQYALRTSWILLRFEQVTEFVCSLCKQQKQARLVAVKGVLWDNIHHKACQACYDERNAALHRDMDLEQCTARLHC